MISTRDLSELPEIDTLRRLMQSLAMLDAIMMPEWQYRYFSFSSRWSSNEAMGSMRDGAGDHYFALFSEAGCWLKGFCHEAPLSPFAQNPPAVTAGVLDGIPAEFAACLSEPAFVIEETTFCIWQRYGGAWQHGPVQLAQVDQDPDGSAVLLRYLDGRPETYHGWAAEYYEREVPLEAVRSIYARQPLDQQVVSKLNDDIALADLTDDVNEIDYPRFV